MSTFVSSCSMDADITIIAKTPLCELSYKISIPNPDGLPINAYRLTQGTNKEAGKTVSTFINQSGITLKKPSKPNQDALITFSPTILNLYTIDAQVDAFVKKNIAVSNGLGLTGTEGLRFEVGDNNTIVLQIIDRGDSSDAAPKNGGRLIFHPKK